MKSIVLKIFSLGFIFLLAIQSNAQNNVVHGMIHCFDSIPLIGAEIKVKSTKQIVLSDTLGNFSVVCNTKDKLIVSANGFSTEKINLKEGIKLVAVNLKLKSGERNKEYAIGYAHVSDREKLNAVSSINKDELDFSMYTNMYDLIRGRFAGVQIQNNGDIIIRGVNSINMSSAALIVVDGVPSNTSIMTSIPPSQVKNISVLKDGGASIYGTRGANGVVLIETRRGGDD